MEPRAGCLLAHGTDPRVRMAVPGERVAALRAISTQPEASCGGAASRRAVRRLPSGGE